MRLALVGARYAESTAQLGDTLAGLSVNLSTLDLRWGYRADLGVRWALAPALVGQLGQFSGRGFGVDRRQTPVVPWRAAGIGVDLTYRLGGRWLTLLAVDALLPFERTEFTLNRTSVHQPAALVGSAQWGVVFEL